MIQENLQIKITIHCDNTININIYSIDKQINKSSINLSTMTKKIRITHPLHIMTIILSYTLLILTTAQTSQPPQTTLQLNQLLQIPISPQGYSYYAVNIDINKNNNNKLLLITVQTQRSNPIEIFTSIYYNGIKEEYQKYPNWQSYSVECAYSSIDTCAVTLPTLNQDQTIKTITVYIGIQLFFSDKITILTTLQDIYPFKIGINYNINFTVQQSAVFTLNASDVNQYEQLVVQMQYKAYNTIGKFALYAGIDKIPMNYNDRIQGKFMGAFTQILVLDQLEGNSTYYIVLEGERGSEFDVVIKPFSTSSPKLTINDTLYYYSPGLNQQDQSGLNFSLSIPFTTNQSQSVLPLLVDLNSLAGYGEFQVDYCDGLTNFNFSNLNGESGEVVIPLNERKECYELTSKQGGLLIENLIVGIKNVPWYFSFSIGVFQGQYPLILSPYSQKMGTLVSSQPSRVYDMQSYINQSFVLKFKTVKGEEQLNYTVFECKSGLFKIEKCTKILQSSVDSVTDPTSPQYKQFNYTCKQLRWYKLQISHSQPSQPLDTQFILLLLPLTKQSTNLLPGKPIFSIVEKNQYQYYVVNLTLIQKQSNITLGDNVNVVITMIETNGDCMMLTSFSEMFPSYEQVFEGDKQVDYSWDGKKQYAVNSSTQAIYVGIMGAKQSLYHLQVAISANEDAPQSFTKLVSDKLLSFTLSSQLNQDHILLSYTAHSIPYTIIISPQPACIVYSFQLPFTDTSCRQLPNQLTQKTIFMKVYRKSAEKSQADGEDFKFTVYVYSGSHYLFQYNPIMIACEDTCYQYVTVFVPEKIKIVHKGMGYIGRKDTDQSFSNQKMQLTCQNLYPCFSSINASLPYGGQMTLFYDSQDIQQIQWISKPLTFDTPFDPKLFYMQIRAWDSLNTAIFYTQGVSLTIYYNIYSIRKNASNALQYEFPNSMFWMRKSVGNPLRRFHVVEFDENLIQELGCKDDNYVCIATLAVYPNGFAQYSTEYVNKSLGYFSCNTYEYYIPLNSPYQLSQQYSLIYFTHQLSQQQQSVLSPFYYVKIKPLSSCRPQIFPPFLKQNTTISYNNDMPYYGIYKIDSSKLNKQNPQIEFIISTDTPCQYTLWLMNSNIEIVVENANYQITSDENGVVMFAYSDKYLWREKKFTVKFDQIVNEIIIDTYTLQSNSTIKQPQIPTALAYITNSKQLQFSNQQSFSTLYTIKATTTTNHTVNMKLTTQQDDTIVMTNQIQKLMFTNQINSVSYRYYSNNDFLIFITNDWGSVRLTVTDYKRVEKRDFINIIINENSDPWVKVNALKGDIRQYVITLENVLLANDQNNNNIRNLQQSSDNKFPKVTFHIQQTGTIGLARLYDGIALFDAFYNEDGQNCYKYLTEMIVGREQLTVDLIFGSEFINKLPTIHSRVSITNNPSNPSSTWTKLPTGYRLSTSYSSNQTYQLCFSINQSPQLVSKQYYVIVENTPYSLRHLNVDVPYSTITPFTYQIYQYVATQNQSVMIEVVNCHGKPTLLGTKNYSDIYLGQVSQLVSFYRDDTMSVAMANINLGYYYFAIKLNDLEQRYKIRLQLMKENQKLHVNQFALKEKVINHAKVVLENGREKVRVNLPPISTLNLTEGVQVHHITYNLLVDNLHSPQQYSSSIIAKCPILANRNLTSYKFTQTLINKFQTTTQQQIRIDIPISQVPEDFNLTGYVEVSISQPYSQTLTYYYESSTFKLSAAHEKSTVTGLKTAVIVVILIGCVVIVFIAFRRWRKYKQNSSVDFEMANYNYPPAPQQSIPTTPAAHYQLNEEVISDYNTPKKSLKKALNQNVGYGQFVDESA